MIHVFLKFVCVCTHTHILHSPHSLVPPPWIQPHLGGRYSQKKNISMQIFLLVIIAQATQYGNYIYNVLGITSYPKLI